jgi:1,4-alpha-glucan branching enzyme
MHDTLKYLSLDPIFRKFYHNTLTFRMLYAFHENFVLPLSHDEVVHGKGSLLNKMPGDDWQKFAGLRLLFGYMYGQPGKKLLFMGDEFGQWSEWYHEVSLDWHLLDDSRHAGVWRWLADLNRVYRAEASLWAEDFSAAGFEWIDCNDMEQSIISSVRLGREPKELILVVCNFTPRPRYHYRVGVPRAGFWQEILNSDAGDYGGSGHGNWGGLHSDPVAWHSRQNSLDLTVPPLGALFFKWREA